MKWFWAALCCRLQHGPARALASIAVALFATAWTANAHAITLAEAPSRGHDMIGEAFDLDNTKLLYREFHKIDEINDTHDVEYRGGDGQLLVLKRLLGGRSVITPEFSQVDFRTGGVLVAKRREQQWLFQRGVVENVSGGDVVTDEVGEQLVQANELVAAKVVNEDASPTLDFPGHELLVDAESVLPDSAELVIDAGFDAFVRGQWNRLQQGQRLQFDFAVPARGRTVRLNIEQVALSYCERSEQFEGTFTQALPATQARVCFKLDARGWLAQMLLKPIYLTYANESRQLLAYAGLSNIKNNSGEALNVYIRYRYAE
ncbi:MAG: hypothetical protein WBN40_13590 [Pseudomonadales bacterium]